ncbi:MAG: hypothetical protein WD904_08860 [Dehalococcoidia bacterium]
MSAPLWFATALTRSWTATYTRGLPAGQRSERCDEIDCDLWEHQRLADFEREPINGTAAAILLRFALGIPADVIWRMEAGSTARSGKGTTLNDTPIMRIGFLVAMLPLVALVANGIGIVLGGGEFDSRTEQIMWGLSFALMPLIAALGLWLCATRPKLGLGLVVSGTLISALLMYWMAFITVPIGLVIIGFAIKRSGLSIWPFNGPRPSATGVA